MHQIHFGRNCASVPSGGAYDVPPDPLVGQERIPVAGFGGRKGRGGEESKGKGTKKKREREGGRERTAGYIWLLGG